MCFQTFSHGLWLLHNFSYCRYLWGPVVDKLISVESDENMDEDVFAEDQEVCDVMRGVAGHSPSPHAISPLSPTQSHHHRSTSDNSRNQVFKLLYYCNKSLMP